VKIDALTVALRPRTSWEAVELGMALSRRHLSAIWKPWLVLSLPILLLVHAAAWSLHNLWLATLAMWWLKPWFDHVPLYVLSRATFGEVPTLRQTLQAQWRWSGRRMWPHLIWRRLGPVRALYLPVDVLEGNTGTVAGARRRALGAPIYGATFLLTVMCFVFACLLQLGMLGLVVVFIPNVYLAEAFNQAKSIWSASPWWMILSLNATFWLATSVIEPFYIGAGFGLYINRRTQLEAWDIELAFRRLRARLSQPAWPLALLLAWGMAVAPMAGHAQLRVSVPVPAHKDSAIAADTRDNKRDELKEIFGDAWVDDAPFRKATERAYADPTLNPKRKEVSWEPRDPPPLPKDMPEWRGAPPLGGLGTLFSVGAKLVLWGLLAALVVALVVTAARWLPWFRAGLRREKPSSATDVQRSEAAESAPLPSDIPTAIRRLWYGARRREALAMLYRASVEAMVEQTQVMLVPGATEAECLRASRRLAQQDDREAFARVVRMWQYAAYAQSFPATDAFESLLVDLAQRFSWRAASLERGAAA
jgi:hypothetical protein